MRNTEVESWIADVSVTGVEQRPHLVDIAEAAAVRMGVEVDFKVGYCGWGGGMPSAYRLVLRESCAGTLDLWVKADA